jgi:hypothetical protein
MMGYQTTAVYRASARWMVPPIRFRLDSPCQSPRGVHPQPVENERGSLDHWVSPNQMLPMSVDFLLLVGVGARITVISTTLKLLQCSGLHPAQAEIMHWFRSLDAYSGESTGMICIRPLDPRCFA